MNRIYQAQLMCILYLILHYVTDGPFAVLFALISIAYGAFGIVEAFRDCRS